MNKKQNQLATPTEQRQEQERQTNEALLAEDAVQTTAYLANAPDCCSGAEQLDHVLGMLGSDVMDDGIYSPSPAWQRKRSRKPSPRICAGAIKREWNPEISTAARPPMGMSS